MKQVKVFAALVSVIISALVFFTVSLTACRKNTDSMLNKVDLINTTDSPYTSVINYKIYPVPAAAGSIFQWTAGYINTQKIIFNATKNNGNYILQKQYETWTVHTMNILPGANIGALKVPALTCDHASFTVELGRSETTSALLLRGTFTEMGQNMPNRQVPFQVVVDETVDINTVWLANASISKTNYVAAIQFSLDQLMAGIDAGMMLSADATDGTVLITNTSNQNLYSIIIGNLQNGTSNVQFWPELVNAATSASQ